MKLIIENTSKIVKLNDCIDARIWEGKTSTGIKVHCYVARIAIQPTKEYEAEFAKELQKVKAPTAEVSAIPFRLIL